MLAYLQRFTNAARRLFGPAWAIWAVFALALIARFIFFFLIAWRGTDVFYAYSDGQEYLTVAYNLLAGRGFSVRSAEPFWPSSYYVPGYPYTLAGVIAIGLGVRTIILTQVIVGAGVAALVAWQGRHVVGRHGALIAGILLALEPSTVFWNNQLVTETFSTALMIVAAFLLLRMKRVGGVWQAIIIGALLGVSTLYRHAGQYLILLFAAWALFFVHGSVGRRLAAGILCIVFGAALLVPWVVHNERVFGIRFFSTASGSLGIGKNLQYFAIEKYDRALFDVYNVAGPTAEEAVHPYAKEYNIIRKAQAMFPLALRILREDPLGLFQVYAAGWIPFFFGDGFVQIATVVFASTSTSLVIWDGRFATLWQQVVGRPDMIIFLFGKGGWVGMMLVAVWGVLQILKRGPADRRTVLFLLMLIAYYAVASGVAGYSRFRFPVTAFILMFAGAGLADLFGDAIRRRRLMHTTKRLLIVTQVVDRRDSDLGFFHEWIEQLARRADQVTVVALREGETAFSEQVFVWAPKHRGKFLRNIHFVLYMWWAICTHRAVFFHMCPEYVLVGAPLARLFGQRTLLWYTHRSVTRRLRWAVRLADRTFTAAPDGCRIASPKVEVTGHGIMLSEKLHTPSALRPLRLIVVGRISPIKHFSLVIDALAEIRARGIPAELTIVGGPFLQSDQIHVEDLRVRVERLLLTPFVRFHGEVAHAHITDLLLAHDLLINPSPNGPDKVVYEAAAVGMPCMAALPAFRPVFGRHADLLTIASDNPTVLVERVQQFVLLPLAERAQIGIDLRTAVEQAHSLSRLADRIQDFLFPR